MCTVTGADTDFRIGKVQNSFLLGVWDKGTLNGNIILEISVHWGFMQSVFMYCECAKP